MYSRKVWGMFGLVMLTQLTPHCSAPARPEIGTPVTIERCVEQPAEASETGCTHLAVPSGQIAVCQVFEGGELIQYPDGHRVCEQ